ncbi:MAG: hypothetical protein CVU65_00960 [Deltaproteobacteria bacterium HGW-Deltaproteobacteria-22]|jgi:spermidine synthase|nr:MAG: hypothetical protein CVU65_00960 [Deltaproteobacteria bacterium HGW-Deltaproteobacteria-22]
MTLKSSRPVPLSLISILLFFSGAAGLVYEVIWTRILHYTFGNTEMAAATVLATFMGGMALGGALGGKFAPRIKHPVLAYGILEAVIAVYGLLFTPLLYKMDFIYLLTGPDPGPTLMMFIRFVVGGLLILVPTVAMGATLPILVHGAVEKEHPGKSLGVLYFINTLGAVAGTMLSGFILIPMVGLDVAVYLAVMMGLFVFLGAVFIEYRLRPVPGEELMEQKVEPTDDAPAPPAFEENFSPFALKWGASAAVAFAFVCGFISLSNEILWFRLLGILMDGTIYGFSALLSAYLAGLAFGSLLISRRLDKSRDLWALFTKLQIGAAVGAILTILILPLMPFLISGYIASEQKSPGSVFALKLFLVFLSIATPTFFYGASFPVLARLASVRRSLSTAVGNTYAMNTVGCILGAGLTGLILIPTVKNLNALLQFMIFFSILVALVSAMFARVEPDAEGGFSWLSKFRTDGRLRLLTGATLVFLGMVIIDPNVNVIRLVNSRYSVEDYSNTIGSRVKSLYGDPNDLKNLLFQAEGAVTVVTVHKTKEGGLRLRNNGLNEAFHAATDPHYAEEILYLGMLPYFLHPNPEKVLLIGLGGGGTLDMLSHGNFKQIEVAELEPEVVKASRFMFGNRPHPLDNPNVRLRLDDGRNALARHARANPHTYDIVVSQPSHPWLSGASNLYTLEHFRIVRKNLKPGGMLCQWVNLFRMNEVGFRSLMAAFVGVFPDGHVFQVDENSVFLIGVNGEFKVDPDIIKKHLKEENVKPIVKSYGITLNRILRMYLFPMDVARMLGRGSVVNSDRHPVIETVLPWVGHNTMFRVQDVLNRHKQEFGLSYLSMKQGSASVTLLREFADYLISRIDLSTQEITKVKQRADEILKLTRHNEVRLLDERHRIDASLYEKLGHLEKAVEAMGRIETPSLSDHMKTAGWLLQMEKPALALPRLLAMLLVMERPLHTGTAVLAARWLPGVEADMKMQPGTIKSGVVHQLGRALWKLDLRAPAKLLVRWLAPQTDLYEQLDVTMWHLLATVGLESGVPVREHFDAYVNLGGNDQALLKKLLMYYAKAGVEEKVDYIVSVLKSLPNLDYQALELARKCEKLEAPESGIRILENLERQTRHLEVERQDILKELIRMKTVAKKWEGLGLLVVKYKEMADEKEFETWTKETFKDLEAPVRDGLIMGVDPIPSEK